MYYFETVRRKKTRAHVFVRDLDWVNALWGTGKKNIHSWRKIGGRLDTARKKEPQCARRTARGPPVEKKDESQTGGSCGREERTLAAGKLHQRFSLVMQGNSVRGKGRVPPRGEHDPSVNPKPRGLQCNFSTVGSSELGINKRNGKGR